MLDSNLIFTKEEFPERQRQEGTEMEEMEEGKTQEKDVRENGKTESIGNYRNTVITGD